MCESKSKIKYKSFLGYGALAYGLVCSASLLLSACSTVDNVSCPAEQCQLADRAWPPMAVLSATRGADAAAELDPLAQSYQEAVRDALTIEADEVMALVTLNKGDPLVTYDDQGRVLLLTAHRVPDVFKEGSKDKLKLASWTFTDKEFAAWLAYILRTQAQDVADNTIDWRLRIGQLLGMPANAQRTHVTALWVKPEDVIRPAYSTDIYSHEMSKSFADAGANHDAKYQEWFKGKIIDNYFSDYPYPWTRLGYSYDWGNPCSDYGLSEFLVRVGAPYEVAYTLTIDDFVAKMRQELTASSPDLAAAAGQK